MNCTRQPFTFTLITLTLHNGIELDKSNCPRMLRRLLVWQYQNSYLDIAVWYLYLSNSIKISTNTETAMLSKGGCCTNCKLLSSDKLRKRTVWAHFTALNRCPLINIGDRLINCWFYSSHCGSLSTADWSTAHCLMIMMHCLMTMMSSWWLWCTVWWLWWAHDDNDEFKMIKMHCMHRNVLSCKFHSTALFTKFSGFFYSEWVINIHWLSFIDLSIKQDLLMMYIPRYPLRGGQCSLFSTMRFLSDVLKKNIDLNVFDDVWKKPKHRINDASNDVNRPPLGIRAFL